MIRGDRLGGANSGLSSAHYRGSGKSLYDGAMV
jgi:hypothetical protein